MKVTKYSDIKMGQSAEVVHTVTGEDIQVFGDLSGDYNPLHFDEEWAKTTMFGGRIAHGILTASFISNLLSNDIDINNNSFYVHSVVHPHNLQGVQLVLPV